MDGWGASTGGGRGFEADRAVIAGTKTSWAGATERRPASGTAIIGHGTRTK